MRHRIPAEEGLFDIPEDTSQPFSLNGSRCGQCGRYFFPKSDFCPTCPEGSMEDAKLGRAGRLYSYTNCNYPPPGGHYKGKVPYGMGLVLLDEDIIIPARLTVTDTSKLRAGMEMKLVPETLYEDDEGNEVLFYAFEPKP
jgi:uncharacterized protein